MRSNMSRSGSAVSLKTSSLYVYSHSLSLGPHHKKMLSEKRREFQHNIKMKKKEFDQEAQDFLGKSTPKDNSQNETYRKLRATQQGRLEDLQEKYQERLNELFHRFQREWMENPIEDKAGVGYSGSEHGAYIASTVGRALELGLTEVCLHQPEDPIEFLSHWLRAYSMNIQKQKEEAIEALQLQIAKEEQYLEDDRKVTLQNEMVHIAQDEHRRKEEYLKLQSLSLTDESVPTLTDAAHSSVLDSTQAPSVMSLPVPVELTTSGKSRDFGDVIPTPPVSPIEDDVSSEKSDDSRGMAVLYTIHEKTTEEHDV